MGSPPLTLHKKARGKSPRVFLRGWFCFTIEGIHGAKQITSVFNFKQCKGLLTRDINGRILKKEGDLKLNNTTC